ncbi:DUF899 domain-containing protein [Nocardia sp. SYP-A9097]|nr:DUF899 domain-containing protein [Nocardia sp. SYP-A9097]
MGVHPRRRHERAAVEAPRRRLPTIKLDNGSEFEGPGGTSTLLDPFHGLRGRIFTAAASRDSMRPFAPQRFYAGQGADWTRGEWVPAADWSQRLRSVGRYLGNPPHAAR